MTGVRILIVDDSSFIRQLMLHHLVTLGAECTVAVNGSEALDLLRRPHRFDLLLIDVNMPVMSGLECVRRMGDERLGGGMKTMMVTTEADAHFIEQALALGADEFLMKPFTVQSLREKLLLLGFPTQAA